MSNLKEKIGQVKDLKSELVNIEQWDNIDILMKSMTGRQRNEFMSTAYDKDGKPITEKLYPELLKRTAYDPESDELIFSDGDEELILSKNASVLEKLAIVAFRLSGLAQNSIQEAEKN